MTPGIPFQKGNSMSPFSHTLLQPVKTKSYILVLVIVWSAIIIASLIWNVMLIKKANLELAHIHARASFEKDVLYRKWNAWHGGVYVPKTKKTPSNPYLKAERRDIVVDTSLVLTLINPAYMTRQVYEFAADKAGLQGHITSFTPVRPENAPDPWEKSALESFQNRDSEASMVEEVQGAEYLRLMKPLVTEKNCLKCHVEQGYRTGDICGGISVSVPIAPYRAVENSNITAVAWGHGLLWIFGLTALYFGSSRLNRDLAADHRRSESILKASEKKYRGIFNDSVTAIYLLDKNGMFLDANQAGLDLLGYTAEELLSMDMVDVSADRAAILPVFQRLLIGERIINYEHQIEKKNGEAISVLNNSIPVLDEHKNIVGIQSTLIDVTELRQRKQQLIENEARWRALIDTLPDLVWLKDVNGVFIACNASFEVFIGKKEAEIIGKDDYAFVDRAQADSFRSHDRLAIEKGGPNINEEELLFADGHREIIETIKTPMFTKNGQLIGVLGIGRDITERKLKEKIQATKLRLLDFAADHSHHDTLRRFLDEVEELTESMVGFFHFVEEDQETLSLQAWSTNTLENMCSANGVGMHYSISEAGVWVDCVRERNPVIHNDYKGLKHKKGLPEGHAPIVREIVIPVIRGSKIKAILGVGNKRTDYTARDVEIVDDLANLLWETVVYKRAQEAQRESEEKYRSMMEAMDDGVSIISSDFRIEYLNPGMIRRLGHDATGEFCYMTINDLDKQCQWCPKDRLQKGESFKSEVLSPKDGRYYQLSSSPLVHQDGSISRMTIYTDITYRKEAEEKLRQSQRLESIGNLAGGIAHDFNNLLFPIIGYSELLISELPPESLERENVAGIMSAAKRAKDLIQQILSFSRQSEHKLIPIRIQQILAEVIKLCRSTIPANIQIRKDIQPKCREVLADPTQLHQIAMNLITNAYHAVEANNGQISVGLKEVVIGTGARPGLSLSPGEYACLSVSDTGHGIAQENLGKIFDPYFTTKEQGKGTGLGLSVVYGIIQEHGGGIDVDSVPGKGTTFNVFLPLLKRDARDTVSKAVDTILPTGTESILLVDDEAPIADIESKILTGLGYKVVAHVNSLNALEAFRAAPKAFDVIITDMSMPHMTGVKLAEEAVSIRHDIPVIICTGYSENLDDAKAESIGVKGILMKPCGRVDLAKMIRKVLDEQKGSALDS